MERLSDAGQTERRGTDDRMTMRKLLTPSRPESSHGCKPASVKPNRASFPSNAIASPRKRSNSSSRLGCTSEEAFTLVGSVFERPTDAVAQEVGGVMVTLAALCLATDVEMFKAGEAELARVWTKIDEIRAKQATTPDHSPLSEAIDPSTSSAEAKKQMAFEQWTAEIDRLAQQRGYPGSFTKEMGEPKPFEDGYENGNSPKDQLDELWRVD